MNQSERLTLGCYVRHDNTTSTDDGHATLLINKHPKHTHNCTICQHNPRAARTNALRDSHLRPNNDVSGVKRGISAAFSDIRPYLSSSPSPFPTLLCLEYPFNSRFASFNTLYIYAFCASGRFPCCRETHCSIFCNATLGCIVVSYSSHLGYWKATSAHWEKY